MGERVKRRGGAVREGDIYSGTPQENDSLPSSHISALSCSTHTHTHTVIPCDSCSSGCDVGSPTLDQNRSSLVGTGLVRSSLVWSGSACRHANDNDNEPPTVSSFYTQSHVQ